jgi:hypothetical protein
LGLALRIPELHILAVKQRCYWKLVGIAVLGRMLSAVAVHQEILMDSLKEDQLEWC